MRRLFSKKKLPGWIIILWGVFTYLPDQVETWKTRIEFWQEAAKRVSDNMALIASVVASPWFGAGLLLLGIAYLVFVGESKARLQHPIWPLLGWTVVGIVFLAFWSVLVAGYVAERVAQQETGEAGAKIVSLSQDLEQTRQANKQLEDKVVSLQKQQQPWVLSGFQRKKLVDALNKVPPGTTYQLKIFHRGSCDQCARYASDLGDTLYDVSGWEVRTVGSFTLSVHERGVSVAVDMEGCSFNALVLVMKALDAAEIKYEKVQTEGKMSSGACAVIVGDKPQE